MHLLAGIGAAAIVQLPLAAQAQVAPSDPVPTTSPAQDPALAGGENDIVVTGLRASLQRAIDVKRNADVIVDSIASEDLGKFPDSNVAESLQRITGVSIDRSGGEGQFVTVRGFGPSFNTVLVNGRTIATENAGRAFSFDLLAAELISGADVYKSSNAVLQDGGIGSTINVKTARPFDIPGTKIVLSAKASYEDIADKFAGEGFGLISTTLADGRLGLLLAGSYQRRKAQVNTVATNGYFRTNLPQAGLTNVYFPQNLDQIVDRQDRERIGINATAQFRATDTLTLSLDGLYNKFTVESNASSLGHFFSPGEITSATLDDNRTVTSMAQSINGKTDYISRTFNRPTEVYGAGLNLEWKPTDLITVVSDSSYSKAVSNNGGNEVFAVVGFPNRVTFTNNGGIPSVVGQSSFTDNVTGRAHFATREGIDTSEELYEQRLEATFKTNGGFVKDVKVGGYFLDRTKENALIRSENNVGCAYCGYAIPVPNGLLQTFNAGNFLKGEGADLPRQWLTFDSEAYFSFLESTAAANAQDAAVGRPVGSLAAFLAANNGYAPIRYPDSFRIGERIVAGYAQIDFESELGGLPISGGVGARYVHTDVTSNGSQQVLLDLRLIPNDPTAYTAVFAPTAAPVQRKTNYTDFLPSANVRMDFTDQIVGRLAASRTVTRPDVTLLAPRVSFTNLRPGNLQASGGNPELKPYKSTNFDGSFEYYYQKGGYFTVGAFYKRVNNFIVSQVAPEPFALANADNIFPGGIASVNVRRPRNLEAADVYGVEIGFQHTFNYLPAPLDGLGVTANATFVKSSAGVDTSTTSQTFALEGLGNSQNVVLFYEKGPIQARVAYNHRNEFLQTLANGTGGDPIFVEPLGQFDVSARYSINENVAIFVEGVNITNATTKRHGRFDNQFLAIVETGARYKAGVRVDF
ncbi:TonB-dependent receptor [Sphingomonas sp. SUN019]|uniref:TonB-dependent receptor n=1 Tax=Sphingomonas sp. SUN019 TaxID=2937788 RepID=UPI0021643712|nr:TonB-dependent receptor [Sphingomonas sp. SUN019]UVO49538.1 TonB-dependent receptor [Sphingomonas sp. SUN019]